jgi:tRNA pseudouridine13 synthase
MYKIKQLPEDFVVKELSELQFDESGRYSYYLLKKRDYSTLKAVEVVAEKLGVSRKLINFAGTKDRKAVTEQFVSVQGGKPAGFVLGDIELKYLGRGAERLNLGSLSGNHFEITVRNLENAKIRAMKTDLQNVPNYFGEQRFGARENNEVVGKLIVKKQFRQACLLIPETHGWLNRKPNDFIGALRSIDRAILRMYVHAYQSYLWNKMAGMLVKKGQSIKVPILGFETEIEDAELKLIVDQILREENLSLREFVIREIPELSSGGGERELFVDVQDFKAGKPEADELNEGKKKVLLSFSLPKGSYATVVVKWLFS